MSTAAAPKVARATRRGERVRAGNNRIPPTTSQPVTLNAQTKATASTARAARANQAILPAVLSSARVGGSVMTAKKKAKWEGSEQKPAALSAWLKEGGTTRPRGAVSRRRVHT